MNLICTLFCHYYSYVIQNSRIHAVMCRRCGKLRVLVLRGEANVE